MSGLAKKLIQEGKVTPDQILAYQCNKRPSIWSQYYTKLRGKDYRFEQRLPDGSLDLRKPQEIPRGDSSMGILGQRQFLQEMLDDQHPHKATQKSRQCGASENEVRETLWFGDVHPYTKQAYVFPTFDQVADFSKTRIEEVMKESPYVKQRMGIDPVTNKKLPGETPVDNVRLRRIGNSFIFFRSGHTPRAGEGIDCDRVVFDELDRQAPNVAIAFNETLSSSAFGWRRDVSTPSLPGVGVNASFQNSDAKHWMMKCSHCGTWFTLIHDWEKHVVELPKDRNGAPNHDYHFKYPWLTAADTHMYLCRKCREPISDETRVKGIWRPLYTYKTSVSGYQISQLMCAWISASKLMKKRDDYKLTQLFVNYVIGLPYLGDNVMITEGDILRCIDMSMTNPYDFQKRSNIVIGGDWGNTSWGVAAMRHPNNPQQTILLDIWSVDDDETMVDTSGRRDNPHIRKSAEKIRQWRAKRAVMDAGYGKDRNWHLLQDFPGKIFSCFYPSLATDVTKNVKDQWHDNDYKVNVDRTVTLKILAKDIRDGKWVIPAWVASNPLFQTFKTHLRNLVLVRDIDEDPITKKETIKERVGTLPGGDHFGHAMNYVSIGIRELSSRGKSDLF